MSKKVTKKSGSSFGGLTSFLKNLKNKVLEFYTESTIQEHQEGEKFSKGSGLRVGIKKIRWIRTGVTLLILVLAVLSFVYSVFGIKSRGTYTSWDWNMPAGGFTQMEHGVAVEQFTPNAPLFWAHQFKFVGGDGGYVGLQPASGRVDGTFGKTVLFSVFGAGINGTKGACVVEASGFDGYNMSGTSCRVAYDWVPGRKYIFKVKLVSTDNRGKVWQAWVKDDFTGVEKSIAQIRTPGTWTGIGNWSVMWTEYFGGDVASCASLPYSKAFFYEPVANGNLRPKSSRNYLSIGNACNNSVSENVLGGAKRQITGILPQSNARRAMNQDNAQRVVECAYDTFLARKPDTSGGNYWKKRYLERGKDLSDLAKGLFYSNEGQTKASSLGFDAFVKRMYTSCLGRTAPSADVSAWGAKNRAGVKRDEIFVVMVKQAMQQII